MAEFSAIEKKFRIATRDDGGRKRSAVDGVSVPVTGNGDDAKKKSKKITSACACLQKPKEAKAWIQNTIPLKVKKCTDDTAHVLRACILETQELLGTNKKNASGGVACSSSSNSPSTCGHREDVAYSLHDGVGDKVGWKKRKMATYETHASFQRSKKRGAFETAVADTSPSREKCVPSVTPTASKRRKVTETVVKGEGHDIHVNAPVGGKPELDCRSSLIEGLDIPKVQAPSKKRKENRENNEDATGMGTIRLKILLGEHGKTVGDRLDMINEMMEEMGKSDPLSQQGKAKNDLMSLLMTLGMELKGIVSKGPSGSIGRAVMSLFPQNQDPSWKTFVSLAAVLEHVEDARLKRMARAIIRVTLMSYKHWVLAGIMKDCSGCGLKLRQMAEDAGKHKRKD